MQPGIKHKKVRYILKGLISALLIWFLFFALPAKPFEVPYSKTLYAENGQLLNAQVARDYQWRFPADKEIPEKFKQCILTFEDRNFNRHIGISATGLGRAITQNISKGKIVSGGSTITMQTIRLMQRNPARNFPNKMLEMLLAVRLEMRYSKKEILQMYCAHAPFGTNVVGLEAASWRYFGKKATELTWGQSALLAVLPNAPGLLYPGKNHAILQAKRNRLLQQLFERKIITEEILSLSLGEPIPDKPLPLPDKARQYFSKLKNTAQSHAALDFRIQEQCLNITDRYAGKFHDNQVENIAIIVSDVKTGKLLAYIGNTDKKWNPNTAFVNCAAAPRSTGSVLKPFLYYEALRDGLITPQKMLPDIPVSYNNFRPQNYARTYEGLIPANKALAKSLNIPMVGLLNEYGLQKFHADLRQLGFRNINRSATDYGLSLILGSGEISLEELNTNYRNWTAKMWDNKTDASDKASVYETLEAMTELNRPDENGNWKAFINTQKIAWKTGTSFGNRDAWCVGISANYVITVWVGNADGSGRTGLTGIEYAAPIMFDVFNALPKNYKWFARPEKGYATVKLCSASGHKAGPYCSETSNRPLPANCVQVSVCPFHHPLSVNEDATLQVDASVYNWQDIRQKNYFILPSAIAHHFKAWNPDYKAPPPWHEGARNTAENIQIVFPNQSKILLFGTSEQIDINFKAINSNKKSNLYWHINEEYIGATKDIHELRYALREGKYQLSVIDELGNKQQTIFEVINAAR